MNATRDEEEGLRWWRDVLIRSQPRLSDSRDVPWCTLAVSVPIPNEGELLFIATTTSWRLSAEAARERQVVLLTDLDARHRRTLPTVIAGDFNATPDAASIRYLTGLQLINGRSVYYHDAWSVAQTEPGYTWTSDNPNTRSGINQIVRQQNHRRRVDYVFIGHGMHTQTLIPTFAQPVLHSRNHPTASGRATISVLSSILKWGTNDAV